MFSRPISKHCMRFMPKIVSLFLAVTVAVSVLATSVARKSPEFTIAVPSGKNLPLSSFKGKVVVMEFFFIQSNHCIRVAKLLNKLNAELGTQGLQPIGVVFDPPNMRESGGQMVPPMVDYFKLTYPIGYSTKAEVDSYLGRKDKDILNIPQIVVIDRAGMIRAVSGAAGGDPALEDESFLRTFLDGLLKEKPPATAK